MTKKSIFRFSLLALLAVVFAAQTALAQTTIPSGHPITLEVAQNYRTADLMVGNDIVFRVKRRIDINEYTLVNAGAIAMGKVIQIIPATYSQPQTIQVEVRFVTAVDEEPIYVYSVINFYSLDLLRETVVHVTERRRVRR